MTQSVTRPSPAFAPGPGLLRKDAFQIAYVTNDFDRACEVFVERYGLREFRRLSGDLPGGGTYQTALAWVGSVMYEIVQADGPSAGFYNNQLPLGGFAIRHHHLGYFIEDQARWDALEGEIVKGGWPVVFRVDIDGFLRALYVEAPDLGHYLEYVLPTAGGMAFFANVPVS